ncbi:MAG: hydroxyacid dehydrogenase, partial [Planctomycetota bacterium]
MKQAIMLLSADRRDAVYGAKAVGEIKQLVMLADCREMIGDLSALKSILADTEVILCGWGMMKLDSEFLEAAPRLEAVFYAAGSVRYFVTDEFWERGILLTSAWAANAIPVIEYTVAAIVFGLKRAIAAARLTRRERKFEKPEAVRGLYGARIGIIGAGMIGAGVLERLKDYDVEAFCCDPYVPEERLQELGAKPMDVDTIFGTCDVVSLHAPDVPATRHMVTGEHFRSMKDGAVFINTARGALVNECEMIKVLQDGRIFAFIDVTEPMPPKPESPLYALPNVFLTPHLAGSLGEETRRLGAYAVEELRRFIDGR